MPNWNAIPTVDQRLNMLSAYCAPIFLNSRYLFDGLTEKTTSATMTFIVLGGNIWGLTCRHVVEDRRVACDASVPHGTWKLIMGRIIADFANVGRNGVADGFRYPRRQEIDLALCPLNHVWPILKENGKRAITLGDAKIGIYKNFAALGYPNEGKSSVPNTNGLTLSSKQMRVTGSLCADGLRFGDRFFVEAPLTGNTHIDASGMSGGPVFGLADLASAFDELQITLLGLIDTQSCAKDDTPSIISRSNYMSIGSRLISETLLKDWFGLE